MPAWDLIYRFFGVLALFFALSLVFLHLWGSTEVLDRRFKISTLLETTQPRGNIYQQDEAVATFGQEAELADFHLRLVPGNFSKAAAIVVEKNGVKVADFLLGEVTLSLQEGDRIAVRNNLNHDISITYEVWTETGRKTYGQKSIKAGQRAELSFD